VDYSRLLDGLIEHEELMAKLYREMATKFPSKNQLLQGLSREEETHASMLVKIKDSFFPAGAVSESDIDITMSQLESHAKTIQKLIATLASDTFDEREVINTLLDLELSSAELQINRIVVQNKDDPRLKVFVEILDAEEAHNRVLEDW
jgi:rubrerythrin